MMAVLPSTVKGADVIGAAMAQAKDDTQSKFFCNVTTGGKVANTIPATTPDPEIVTSSRIGVELHPGSGIRCCIGQVNDPRGVDEVEIQRDGACFPVPSSICANMATVLPSPPFIEVPGIANFRGLGGHEIGPGLVFRSADPSKATKDGLNKMGKDLGIRVVYDLRSSTEIKRDGPEWAGVAVDKADIFEPYGMKREWVPVFADDDYSPAQIALRYKEYTRTGFEGFVKAYQDILEAAPPAYTKIFKHLAASSPSPCLVHCTAGKDRTGIFVALLYMLAGTPKEEIAAEYALTDLGLMSLKPLFEERLLKNPIFEGNVEGIRNMTSSKKENMSASIDMIEAHFGGVKNYMSRWCGLSDEEINAVKRNITEGSLSNM
nr:tyrosine-protein phosphatase [Quercus suber]